MEPEVHIIEKWFQEIEHCLTMTNVKCKGGKEIDLLAINPRTLERFHIESRVSTTFNLKEEATYKRTQGRACHKNGLDYFEKEKFEHACVKQVINEIFGKKPYKKVLVVWKSENRDIPKIANEKYGIEVWSIGNLIHGFTAKRATAGSRDDVLRIMELVNLVNEDRKTFDRALIENQIALESKSKTAIKQKEQISTLSGEFVVYVNHPKSYTVIHQVSCHYYNHRHPQDERNGYWKESFKTLEAAQAFAKSEKPNNSLCSVCTGNTL